LAMVIAGLVTKGRVGRAGPGPSGPPPLRRRPDSPGGAAARPGPSAGGSAGGWPEVPGHFPSDGRDWGMAIYVPLITADLARAARALAQVSLLDLAEHTGLDADLLREVERGLRSLTPAQEERLHLAFEEFGVELLPADDDAGVGHGVRQKFNPRTVKRLENWENEGGPSAEDDI